ncbi:MAG: lipocalin family protein [bacterium]|nr:lipocalin family protein [bacterium]
MKKIILGILLLFFFAGCAPTTTERLHLPMLQTVPHVDLDRYLGTWYDIASFPQKFQRGCTASTALYTRRPDGEVDVLNRCRQGSLDGKLKSAQGRARVVDQATNAKLEVSFFRPFWGDYWIIDLGTGYEYAVVGHPSRDYLWILSRTPQLDRAVYDGILARLRAQGYEVERLNRTLQPESSSKGKSNICEVGRDQTCNDNPLISSLHGTCQTDHTCTCKSGFAKNPESGRCL